MSRVLLIVLALSLSFTSNSYSGYFSSSYDTSDSIIAAVQIEGKGIYNLITSIKFLSKPQENKLFESNEYQNFIRHVSIESQGLILQKILEAKSLKVSDFAALKNSIEVEVRNLIEKTKKKHGVAQNAEVVFSIGNFFLLEPREN